MEKPDVCFIRLYPDNPEDALIIAGLGTTRRRKGEKSKLIKAILYGHFKSTSSTPTMPHNTPRNIVVEPSSPLTAFLPTPSDTLSDDREVLEKNLDELSDMLM